MVLFEGDRSGSVKRRTPDAASPNELKEKNKLIDAEKMETGSVSCLLLKMYFTTVFLVSHLSISPHINLVPILLTIFF